MIEEKRKETAKELKIKFIHQLCYVQKDDHLYSGPHPARLVRNNYKW